jgi:hypothetical protein
MYKMSKEINPFHQEIFDKACALNDINLVHQFLNNVELSNGLLIAQTKQHMDTIKILSMEIDRRERIKTRNKKKLLVRYNVKGFDHSGYCSGEEVSDSEKPNKWKHMEIVETSEYNDKNFIIDSEGEQILTADYLEDFETKEDGCTSQSGSGYCKGMYQEYTPYKIYWIKNKINIKYDR